MLKLNIVTSWSLFCFKSNMLGTNQNNEKTYDYLNAF